MKTLYLVRHAKSSWKFDVIDHERPLNERGLRDAPVVAAKVAQTMPLPDLIMSSDATRALHTAKIFAKAYGLLENDIVQKHELYDFAGMQVLQEIRNCDNAVDCLMIFGHNNTMTNIVNTYGSEQVDNVPTASFTCIRFDIESWRDLQPGITTTIITPKNLNT